MVMAVDALVPCTTVRLAGASPIRKSVCATTTIGIDRLDERLPEVPLTVNCPAWGVVPLAAVSVTTELAVALAGLKEAVTPVGNPLAVKPTAEEKAPCAAIVIVAVDVPPADTLTPVEVDESLKLAGTAVTVRATVVLAVTAPDVPVTVTVVLPAGAELLAVNVSRADVLVVLVSNAPVTPAGNPLTESVAVPVKPLTGDTAITEVPAVP
jgi:hypothetical protein